MIHELFPLAIGEYKFEDADDFKNIFLNKLNQYIIHESDGSICAGESTGMNDIHTNLDFFDLFKFVSDSFKSHLEQLNFDHANFDVMICKSWLNILDKNTSTPAHIHDTSHYSFVYYVNVPDNSDLLSFSLDRNPNEPFQGAFYQHDNNKVKTLVKNYDRLNSLDWSFVPKEGALFLFPSNIKHYSKKISNEQQHLRISIAGDILLVYKKDRNPNYPTGLYPFEQWKCYS
jgi:uncharacterized protein (TIGR02466 family)